MNKEELVNLNMKDVILNKWKSKLSYPLNHKDIEELENTIDYYEGLNKKYKEVIDKAIKKLEKEITFCQNESQGLYDKCNIAINRDKRILDILKEVE